MVHPCGSVGAETRWRGRMGHVLPEKPHPVGNGVSSRHHLPHAPFVADARSLPTSALPLPQPTARRAVPDDASPHLRSAAARFAGLTIPVPTVRAARPAAG